MQFILREKQKTLLTLNLRLLPLVFAASAFLAHGCKTPDPREGFYPQIYAGDSAKKAVVRDQANEKIGCEDKRFDEMYCVFDKDLQSLFARCLEQKEREQAWYYFGEKRGGLTVTPASRPDVSPSEEPADGTGKLDDSD
jgi:hypothetical protein